MRIPVPDPLTSIVPPEKLDVVPPVWSTPIAPCATLSCPVKDTFPEPLFFIPVPWVTLTVPLIVEAPPLWSSPIPPLDTEMLVKIEVPPLWTIPVAPPILTDVFTIEEVPAASLTPIPPVVLCTFKVFIVEEPPVFWSSPRPVPWTSSVCILVPPEPVSLIPVELFVVLPFTSICPKTEPPPVCSTPCEPAAVASIVEPPFWTLPPVIYTPRPPALTVVTPNKLAWPPVIYRPMSLFSTVPPVTVWIPPAVIYVPIL